MHTYVLDEFDFKMIKNVLSDTGNLTINFTEIDSDEFMSVVSNESSDIIYSVSAQTSLALKTKLDLTVVPNKNYIKLESGDTVFIIQCSKTIGVNRKYLTTISFFKFEI